MVSPLLRYMHRYVLTDMVELREAFQRQFPDKVSEQGPGNKAPSNMPVASCVHERSVIISLSYRTSRVLHTLPVEPQSPLCRPTYQPPLRIPRCYPPSTHKCAPALAGPC